MARRGYHCGILEADITGPSIPKLFGIHGRAMADDKGCWPLQSRMGIDVMSINPVSYTHLCRCLRSHLACWAVFRCC